LQILSFHDNRKASRADFSTSSAAGVVR
jgi:hypothetical protein